MDMLFCVVAAFGLLFLLYMAWHDPVIGLILVLDLIFFFMLWLHFRTCGPL